MNKLPDKPSELLKVALADYFLVKADPRYTIDLDNWHNPQESGQCKVCLAGSVMAKSFNLDINEPTSPHYLDISIGDKLFAIDEFKNGNLREALNFLNVNNENLEIAVDMRKINPNTGIIEEDLIFNNFQYDIISYNDPELFEAYIQDLIGILEAEGL